MAQGKIKKIVQEKGFGFIENPQSNDVFFHASSVPDGRFDDLMQGQRVDYELDQEGGGSKGPRAKSVRPVATDG